MGLSQRDEQKGAAAQRAHLQARLGGAKVFECEQLRGSVQVRHPRRIDWRHMLQAFKRRPGAFARWVLRNEQLRTANRPKLGSA